MKCVEIEEGAKNENEQKTKASRSTLETSADSIKQHVMLHDADGNVTSVKHRSVLDDSSTSEGKSQAYITYRSCIPAVNEEKLSVIGFEVCIFIFSLFDWDNEYSFWT